MNWVARHRWTFISLVVTAFHILAVWTLAIQLWHQGIDTTSKGRVGGWIIDFHIFATLCAAGIAIGGMAKERPRGYAVAAFGIALFSFFTYLYWVA
jgi:uncharacterized membrane protein